jgi:hypothetical protein
MNNDVALHFVAYGKYEKTEPLYFVQWKYKT